MRAATPMDKDTARQELITFIKEVTGQSIPAQQNQEDAAMSQTPAETEYCHFMLRAPGNNTTINWESLSIQVAAEMSLLQDILGREPSKISVVPAPFPIGSPKFGPECAMAEKTEAHLSRPEGRLKDPTGAHPEGRENGFKIKRGVKSREKKNPDLYK